MRCGICAINYPLEVHVCQVCGEQTDLIKNIRVHETWETKVADKLRVSPELGAKIPNSGAGILRLKGDTEELFVSHKALLNDGYNFLCDFDVVRIKGKYYELQGFIEGGLEEGYWWIQEIDLEKESEWLVQNGLDP